MKPALLALLLSGCIVESLPPSTPVDPEIVDATLAAWSAEYPMGSCEKRSHHLRTTTVDSTQDLCADHVAGCYRRQMCSGLFGETGACIDLIVQHHEYVGPELMRHELTHWLLDCGLGDQDFYHQHPLWLTDGFPGAYFP